MSFNRAYAFFLLITIIGAFLTIKICTAAYSVYDYSGDEVPVNYHHKVAATDAVQESGTDGLGN